MSEPPITYRLDAEGSSSATYYPDVAAFTDEVLAEAKGCISSLARSYRRYIIEYELENPRALEEYTFELLNFGVLWRRYGSTAIEVEMAPFRLLAFLSEWRKKHQRLKPAIDVVRGILMSFFLTPSEPKRTGMIPCCLSDLEYLVRWLEATGDLREDAIRFVRWLAYLASLDKVQFKLSMSAVVRFADWFERASAERMGSYTPNVDSFVDRSSSRYRWREDRFACLRSRVEYHLNMVGAEIMNRAFRQEFAMSEKKTVLLPGCMRFRTPEECEGTKTHKGIRCTGCEASCRVNQVRLLGDRNNYDVMIIPHSSDLSQWASKPGEPVQGVVASACLSVLVQGGWELKRYGVPAQCVVLDYCGCNKHWHSEGFPTQIDVRELKRLVQPDCRNESVRQSLSA